MATEELELVRRHRDGDPTALEEIYAEHARSVWGFARHLTGSPETADEVLQETFLRAANGLARFRSDASLRTWLLSITRRAAADYGRSLRRRGREVPLDGQLDRGFEPVEPDAGADPGRRAERQELMDQMRQAIASLPDAERTCLVLCELQSLSSREAAGATGFSESKVKVSVFRARRRLRAMLARHVDGTGPM